MTRHSWMKQCPQRRLVWKLKQLKNRVKLWAKDQRIQKHLKLDKLEEDLEVYYQEKARGLMSTDADHHIKSLEEEHNKLLQAEEELWRQRSRAIWIKVETKIQNFSISSLVIEGIVNIFGRSRMRMAWFILDRRHF
jgi:hypothetical protein